MVLKTAKHIVVLDIVGLSPRHLQNQELTPNLNRLARKGAAAKLIPPFPPVTGTVQATLTTGYEPSRHGIICNGLYDKVQRKISMWGQNALPLQGGYIWDLLKKYDPGAKTAVLFWQYLKYATADILITPAPVHLEHGLQEWCFSKPVGWYEHVAAQLGPFELKSFWGPLASFASSKWIAQAALATLHTFAPALTLVYLPNLDYEAQRFGPDSAETQKSLREIDSLIGEFCAEIDKLGRMDDTAVVILSEYVIHPVEYPVHINRILREAGLLQVNRIGGKEYLDLYNSKAFALADHQVAHIYVQDYPISLVEKLLLNVRGIGELLGDLGKRRWRIDHPNSGDLVAIASRDAWFTYYWWNDPEAAPPFAHTVDIHRKPGYDPMELFIDPQTHRIPLTPEFIKGSHGVPPVGEEDLVSIIAAGPGSELLGLRVKWAARDIPLLLLKMLGHRS